MFQCQVGRGDGAGDSRKAFELGIGFGRLWERIFISSANRDER